MSACGASVTNVGSLGEDDASTVPPTTGGDAGGDGSSNEGPDGSTDAHADASEDAHADSGCVASCGAKVCGRDDCAHVCGVCGGTTGCFMGACSATCPGTPCADVDGHSICEGERGARSCTGGVKNLQVCTCSGGGANAWINCGACL